MATATFTTTNNKFQQTFTLTKQNGTTLEIPIAGKFVDKNILLIFNTQSATITAGSAQADVNISNIDDVSKAAINIHSTLSKQTTEPNSGYFIAMQASATGNSKVTRAGWVNTGDLTSATTNATKYFSIQSASATISSTSSLPIASLSTGSNTISGKTKITFTPQTTTNISVPYYATFNVTKEQGSITFTKAIEQIGYLGSTSQINIDNLTIPSQQTTYYIPIAAASATNAAQGSATINTINIEYNSTTGVFGLTGSANISGTATLTVTQAGWLPKQNITGNTTGTVTLATTIPKIGINASVTGGGARKPTISRTTTTASGATNVGSASATATAPSSGYFISVQSAANTTTLTAIPAVSSTGYGTPAQYGATNATATVGAAASDITYIPITSGTGNANSASAEIGLFTTDGTAAGINISSIIGTRTNTEPTSGYYLAFSATGSGSSKVTTGGWFPANTILPTASTTVTRYFPVTTATLAITGGDLTAATGHATLSSDGYYDGSGSSINANDKVELTQVSAGGYYKITASGYGEVTRSDIKKQVTKAGYLPQDSDASISIASASISSNTGVTAYYIKKSILTSTSVTSSNTNQNITIPAGYFPTDRTITVNKMIEQTPTTNYTYSGMTTYFNTSTTSTGASVTITPRYSNSAGYVAAHTNTNNGGIGYWTIKTSSTTSTTTTISTSNIVTRGIYTQNVGWVSIASTMPVATFANTATSGETYVDISNTTEAPILVSEDYLYINKGYTDNLKISLAKLIPDDATITPYTVTSTNQILQGYAAYNSAGTLLSGTIPTNSANNITFNGKTVTVASGYYASNTTKNMGVATITSGSATISTATFSWDATNTRFNLTGNATIAAPSVGTAGYISSSEGTKNTNTANLSTTVARIGIKATFSTTGARTPVISRTTTTASGATNVGSAATTTTAPSSGYFVSVQSAANTITVIATPSVSSAGYGTTANYGATSTTGTFGAAASAITYIPIESGTATGNNASVTKVTTDGSSAGINITDVIGTSTTAEPTDGYYAAFTGSGSSKVTKAGWFPTGALTAATSTTTYFPITEAELASEGAVTTNASVVTTNSTNMTTATSGTYYYEVKNTANAGTVQTKYKVTTAGYAPARNATNSGTVSITPTKTNDAKIYIPTATLTVTKTSGTGACSYTSGSSANVTVSDTDTSGVKIAFTGSGTVTAQANVTGAGYRPIANNIASGSNLPSGDKIATKYITGVKVTPGKTFTIQVPNGNTTDYISFVFTVDASGNVTVAGPD